MLRRNPAYTGTLARHPAFTGALARLPLYTGTVRLLTRIQELLYGKLRDGDNKVVRDGDGKIVRVTL
jgi:hypothetical protein